MVCISFVKWEKSDCEEGEEKMKEAGMVPWLQVHSQNDQQQERWILQIWNLTVLKLSEPTYLMENFHAPNVVQLVDL